MTMTAKPFAFNAGAPAIAAWLAALSHVDTQTVGLRDAPGRVLAERVATDRPSPACDVSAMDGYAVRSRDLAGGSLPIAGEVATGQHPPALTAGATLRLFTGGAVPDGADAVIPREQVDEGDDAIGLPADLDVSPGQHIRRCGENAPAGQPFAEPGRRIDSGLIAAMAAVGARHVSVYRPVRCAAIVTGNELSTAGEVTPWQVRDSNGPALESLFGRLPWIEWQGVRQVGDSRAQLQQAIAAALASADSLILTGGVSMGDHDCVPDLLAAMDVRIVFHRLPIRPGKPVLGGVAEGGRMVLGLPGNPVSVLATARRFAVAALRHVAGLKAAEQVHTARLTNAGDKTLGLEWSRLVRRVGPDAVQLIESRGSGDVISAAGSDGFVVLPAGSGGVGPWPFYPWEVHGD